jgi:hypothetical protein
MRRMQHVHKLDSNVSDRQHTKPLTFLMLIVLINDKGARIYCFCSGGDVCLCRMKKCKNGRDDTYKSCDDAQRTPYEPFGMMHDRLLLFVDVFC